MKTLIAALLLISVNAFAAKFSLKYSQTNPGAPMKISEVCTEEVGCLWDYSGIGKGLNSVFIVTEDNTFWMLVGDAVLKLNTFQNEVRRTAKNGWTYGTLHIDAGDAVQVESSMRVIPWLPGMDIKTGDVYLRVMISKGIAMSFQRDGKIHTVEFSGRSAQKREGYKKYGKNLSSRLEKIEEFAE